jgi:hypothetical protein
MGNLVLAFKNRDEYKFVAEDWPELDEKLGEEIDNDQCDNCGSFDPETGEPGHGFIVKTVAVSQATVECACCQRVLPIVWHDEDDTVF